MKIADLRPKAIICRTEEEWERIAQVLHNRGLTWNDNDPYIPLQIEWEGDPQIYFMDGAWGRICDYESEYKEYDLIESTEIEDNSKPTITEKELPVENKLDTKAATEFEVGQQVDSIYGLGEVRRIEDRGLYPVKVVHDGIGEVSYTLDGRLFNCHTRPSLFHDVVKEWPNPPKPIKKPDLKVDDPVWVRDYDEDGWLPSHFAGWISNRVEVWLGGMTSHTTQATVIYKQYRTTKPE